MIEAIFEFWSAEGRWDDEQLESAGVHPHEPRTFIVSEGRLIGPLVKFYRATGHGPALDLALILKEKAITEFFLGEGSYDAVRFGTHTHSTTYTMSSLAQLADLTGDSTLMHRVQAFYDHGLWKIRDALGWVIESAEPDAPSDRGEVNNTGDIVETALILGRWGWPQYFDDAERIVRDHMLPAQLRDQSFIVEPPNPTDQNRKRQVADRHLGAFGFPAPYGHQPVGREMISFNMDIVGGAVASLCEVLREVTRLDKAGHWINLLFDHETDAIKVQSPYTYGAMRLTVKHRAPLFVRMPPWLVRETMRISGVAAPRQTQSYLFIADPPVRRPTTIEFELPIRELVLRHRSRDIRVRLRGDQVVEMDSFGSDLTFFDELK